VDKEAVPTVGDLYPDLNEQALAEAEDHLTRYLSVVLQIFECIETGPQAGPLAPIAGTLGCNPPPGR